MKELYVLREGQLQEPLGKSELDPLIVTFKESCRKVTKSVDLDVFLRLVAATVYLDYGLNEVKVLKDPQTQTYHLKIMDPELQVSGVETLQPAGKKAPPPPTELPQGQTDGDLPKWLRIQAQQEDKAWGRL